MKGTCANCGEHKDVHSYRYSTRPRHVFYLCERCFWNMGSDAVLELQPIKSKGLRTLKK